MESVKVSYRQIGHGEKVYAFSGGKEVCIGKRQNRFENKLEASFPMVTLLNGCYQPWTKASARKMYGYHKPSE